MTFELCLQIFDGSNHSFGDVSTFKADLSVTKQTNTQLIDTPFILIYNKLFSTFVFVEIHLWKGQPMYEESLPRVKVAQQVKYGDSRRVDSHEILEISCDDV